MYDDYTPDDQLKLCIITMQIQHIRIRPENKKFISNMGQRHCNILAHGQIGELPGKMVCVQYCSVMVRPLPQLRLTG